MKESFISISQIFEVANIYFLELYNMKILSIGIQKINLGDQIKYRKSIYNLIGRNKFE